jgi:feruloyl esterase
MRAYLVGAAAFIHTHLHIAGFGSWQDTHASPGRFIQPGQMKLNQTPAPKFGP